MMQKFDGFPPGKHRQITVPARFFNELLPLIDDLAELKVTLFCFQALYQKQGLHNYLTETELRGYATLLDSLRGIDAEADPQAVLTAALDRAVARASLLRVVVDVDGSARTLYFFNTMRGRRAVEQLNAGHWQLDNTEEIEILPERPNIYTLYEENIGLLTPIIADELKDAESSYPAIWIQEAMRLAVENNKRSWRYIHAILKRWQQEGKQTHEKSGRPDGEAEGDGFFGKYSDIVES